jgi:hypothetical protein
MSYHQRPHELRLAVSSEAEALISDFGGDAYAEACRRAPFGGGCHTYVRLAAATNYARTRALDEVMTLALP